MAEEKQIVVKNHVRNPRTMKTYLRGEHMVSEAEAYTLRSAHPDNVFYAEELFSAEGDKQQAVNAAQAIGVPVEETDTVQDLAEKVKSRSGQAPKKGASQPEA